ncbi:MAG: substrate-binding domain-containing protein, partial [Pseudomonadota bacterium]|nr:substrate-binding domain-containing protein [Pseudomonadota bacterium]
FQQRSELMFHDGVDVLGDLPQAAELVTVFSAAIGRDSAHADAAGDFLDFVRSPAAMAVLQDHGMESAG